MWTLAATNVSELEVKRSRFRATAVAVRDREDALAQLAARRDATADHNCWAYRCGTEYRFNDDGEPGGTAGQPILRAIDGQGLDFVLVVVARWFGGVKLGAGGLVRAYGGTAAECLRVAQRREVRPRIRLLLEVPFDCVGGLYPVLESCGACRGPEQFAEAGLRLEVELDQAARERFEALLRDATRGRAKLTAANAQAPGHSPV